MSYQYPETPIPSYPMDISINWKNITSQYDSGKEQSRQKNLYPKYDVKLSYGTLTDSDVQILWNFYQARRGSFEAFYFYTVVEVVEWKGIFVGMGDAHTLIYDIPGKSTTNHVVYANGFPMSSSLYTISYGYGDCYSDRITFGIALAVNTIITVDFTGYLRIRCKFKNDTFTKSLFTYVLYSIGLELKGVANI